MVILEKRKVYKSVPQKHNFEARPTDISLHRSWDEAVNQTLDPPLKSIPLYAFGWGWNASGRSGNATADKVMIPSHVQKSSKARYISAAAGRHHSVVATDEGNVLAFGEGRKSQLGLGNKYSNFIPKGGIFQKIPRSITPTGYYKSGHDLRIVEVACGDYFSVARELCSKETAHVITGLSKLEESLAKLKSMYPDSDKIQLAWAQARHERCTVNHISEGYVATWGTGKNGELGLGRYCRYSPYPEVIPSLKHTSIVKISAGSKHVLAIDRDAHLFTWGNGAAGQLGHSEFENRYTPQLVAFYLPYFVEDCSGGDHHSATLITIRKNGDRDNQSRLISTFGRGAHGRLGNGHNRSLHTPILVDKFPISSHGMKYLQVSCGGAHTLALGSKVVKKTLANPHGIETCVIAWGYGENGQLGTGYPVESFIPVKSRIPKWEIIAEVSAGRSWSLARTITGVLYSWGKGWRGQLGQDDGARFSLIPRIVESYTAFVKLGAGAGYAHNVCVTTLKKHLNTKQNTFNGDVGDDDSFVVETNLKPRESKSMFSFDCCRRHCSVSNPRSKLRFICNTCEIASVCYNCIKHCHRNHDISIRRTVSLVDNKSNDTSRKLQQNSLIKPLMSNNNNPMNIDEINAEWQESTKAILNARNVVKSRIVVAAKKSKGRKYLNNNNKTKKKEISKQSTPLSFLVKYGSRLHQVRRWFADRKEMKMFSPPVDIDRNDNGALPCCRCGLFNSKCHLLPVVPEANMENPDDIFRMREKAAISIQGLGRAYNNKKQLKRMKQYVRLLRYEVCTNHYFKYIIAPVWDKFKLAVDVHKQRREEILMSIEDDLKHKFDYNYDVQAAISGMDAMVFGVKKLFGNASALLPRIRNRVVSTSLHPTFAFSKISIREQQIRLPRENRLPRHYVNLMTQFIPQYDSREGRFFDPDIDLFASRFLRDKHTDQSRRNFERDLQRKEEHRQHIKEQARQEFLLQKRLKKDLMLRAAAITKANEAHAAAPPPAPPRAPLPRFLVVAASERRKIENIQRAQEALKVNDAADDCVFDMFNVKPSYVSRRRHSITDPCKIYSRIITLRRNLQLKGYSKRRNSLPPQLYLMHPTERRPFSYIGDINKSLDIFKLRYELISEFTDSSFEEQWENVLPSVRRKRLRNVLSLAWLNPRLPFEMVKLLQDNSRRRSIAEPERMAKQIEILFATRDAIEILRTKTRESGKFRPRRRSFDYGEELDERSGVTKVLGFNFEEAWELPTVKELRKESLFMEDRVLKAGLFRPSMSANRWKSSKSLSGKGKGKSINGEEDELDEDEAAAAAAANGPSEMQMKLHNAFANRAVPKGKKAAGAASAVVVWREYYSEDGKTYYYCLDTGESVWDLPQGTGSPSSNVQICSQYQSDEGYWYWYNSSTGETTWSE